ncbi:MAG: hypothetical protein JWM16_2867 [Verrucomicrobiales bacterium]|nr:hypothetical protein [Verrucomicrobiales bacterium]
MAKVYLKHPARVAFVLLILGVGLAASTIGVSAYVYGSFPGGWRWSLLWVIIPAAVVGVAGLGIRGVLLLSIPGLLAVLPAVVGFLLVMGGRGTDESGWAWLRSAQLSIYAVMLWGIVLAAKGWMAYFKGQKSECEKGQNEKVSL